MREAGARRLPSAALVRRFHDALCFLRALPDDEGLLAAVEAELGRFATRPDLARHRAALADSGIAGTTTYYRFLLPMARRLALRHPGALRMEWSYVGSPEALEDLLPLLAEKSALPAFDEYSQAAKHWLRLLAGPVLTDAEWLSLRLSELEGCSAAVKDALWAAAQPGFALTWREGVPSRTAARLASSPVVLVRSAPDHSRPDLRRELRRKPPHVRRLSEREGRAVLDVALDAMVVRHRDLDAFSHGNPRDARMIELGDGLQLACVGMLPERRLLLEAVHGLLTLRNGVPIGYVLTSALFGSSEIAYNVFETWRGGESARIYGRVLATAAHLFGSDSFAVDPYQLGHHNDEGLASGAWWFYQKLGFRPKDPAVTQVMESELARMAANPRHRSDRATLRKLVVAPMFFHAGRERDDVLGHLSIADVGAGVLRFLAARFGASLASAPEECAREVSRLLAIPRGWNEDERRALRLWSPLVLALPGVPSWSATERRSLAGVIRAKGGADELEFVRRFDRHRRLRAAVVELQRTRLA